jgi:hypothetical protein
MLEAMARIALRLRYLSSAWAFWLPHWTTCMYGISREDSMDSIQLLYFRWPFLFSAFPSGRLARTAQIAKKSF